MRNHLHQCAREPEYLHGAGAIMIVTQSINQRNITDYVLNRIAVALDQCCDC
jgi:hypothetical protein